MKAPTSRREERRQHQLGLSRTQLLDAAEEVFGAKGYHDATLREVAELAEFSVGTVYSFFESKEDLFMQVLLRRGAEMLPAMRSVTTGEGSALERLHALVDFEVGFFREHRNFGRLYLRTSSTTRPVPDDLEANAELTGNFEEAMQIQSDLFRDGHASGELRNGDPAVLARMFSGLVSAFQSVDVEVSDRSSVPETSLDDLHSVVEGAFRA